MVITPVASQPVARARRPLTAYQAFAAAARDFVSELPVLRGHRDALMHRLATLGRREQRDYVRKVLRDRKLARLYAYEGYRGARQLGSVQIGDIDELAARCNPFQECVEPVQVLLTGKGVRARRRVQNFGPLKRMHQLIVADAIRALHPPRPEQYLFGGGMPMAQQAIEAAYLEGYVFAAELDFVDFYGSIHSEGLADLLHPLPSAVVTSVVWDERIRRRLHEDITVPLDTGHPSLSGLVGLSLGAATSPIVGERIIGHLLDHADLGMVVTYADNVLVLGRSSAEVAARAERLREVAERLETGLLRPRIQACGNFNAPDGVEFAKQVGRAGEHGISWSPNDQRLDEHRMADRDEGILLDQIPFALSQVSQWRRAYPRWETGDDWERMRRAELLSYRYYLSAQPEHFAAAKEALLIACLYTTGEVQIFPAEIAPDGSTRLQRERRERLLTATEEMWATFRARYVADFSAA